MMLDMLTRRARVSIFPTLANDFVRAMHEYARFCRAIMVNLLGRITSLSDMLRSARVSTKAGGFCPYNSTNCHANFLDRSSTDDYKKV
jgi:hypothetical protein